MEKVQKALASVRSAGFEPACVVNRGNAILKVLCIVLSAPLRTIRMGNVLYG